MEKNKDSHNDALKWCIEQTPGRVLECGCGPHSTAILHRLCQGRKRGRQLVSLDNNADWMSRFSSVYAGEQHKFGFVHKWIASTQLDEKWDVAFVDMAPAEVRVPSIHRLADNCTFIVAHDTECDEYDWGEIWDGFKWHRHWPGSHPRTTIMSNERPCI